MIWRRKRPADYDQRLEEAEREVRELKRRVQTLETQTNIYKRTVRREIARAS